VLTGVLEDGDDLRHLPKKKKNEKIIELSPWAIALEASRDGFGKTVVGQAGRDEMKG
jgi:hypothetical protein